MSKKDKEREYHSWCSYCGLPLHKWQIAAIMDETTVTDYKEKEYVGFSAHFCEECWNRMKENNLGGMPKAMKRLKNLNKLQRKEL